MFVGLTSTVYREFTKFLWPCTSRKDLNSVQWRATAEPCIIIKVYPTSFAKLRRSMWDMDFQAPEKVRISMNLQFVSILSIQSCIIVASTSTGYRESTKFLWLWTICSSLLDLNHDTRLACGSPLYLVRSTQLQTPKKVSISIAPFSYK